MVVEEDYILPRNIDYRLHPRPKDRSLTLYFGNDAAVINKTLTRSEVADLISDNGRGIVTVSELPAPSALLAGRLMCLAATNIPYWCTGTAWVDITAISDQAQFDSLQAQITSLNSNKQSVSAKDKSGGYAVYDRHTLRVF